MLTSALAACTGSSPATPRAAAGSSSSATSLTPSASTSPPAPQPTPTATAGRRCPATAPHGAAQDRSALLAVEFVDSSYGWVVTGSGVIATTDGGTHWSSQLNRRVRSAAEVDFIDRTHGWVMADGSLLTTADGGLHWTSLRGPCPQIGNVHFYDTSDGYATTGHWRKSGPWQPGPLLRTSDGGHSWTRVPAPSNPQEVCLTDAQHGWLAAGAKLYRTADGARSWTLVESGGLHGRAALSDSAEVECSGPDDAWALTLGGAASSQQAHTAYQLHDDTSRAIYTENYFPHPGVHTDVESPGSYSGPFSAVNPTTAVFIDSCPACNTGTAQMAVTFDSGRSIMRRGDIPGLSEATGASFVTGEQGWVIGFQRLIRDGRYVGNRYRIMRTDDSGHRWTTQQERVQRSN